MQISPSIFWWDSLGGVYLPQLCIGTVDARRFIGLVYLYFIAVVDRRIGLGTGEHSELVF